MRFTRLACGCLTHATRDQAAELLGHRLHMTIVVGDAGVRQHVRDASGVGCVGDWILLSINKNSMTFCLLHLLRGLRLGRRHFLVLSSGSIMI